MTMITPSYLGETIEYSSLHACRSTLEDPTFLFEPTGRIDREANRLQPFQPFDELGDSPPIIAHSEDLAELANRHVQLLFRDINTHKDRLLHIDSFRLTRPCTLRALLAQVTVRASDRNYWMRRPVQKDSSLGLRDQDLPRPIAPNSQFIISSRHDAIRIKDAHRAARSLARKRILSCGSRSGVLRFSDC